MPSYKKLLNSAAGKYPGLRELNPRESRALKNCLLDIYKQIARVCDANGLVYMLGGGSCLGAVRHQGFIPWDDDLDVNMPRRDYDRFIALCEEGALGDDYFISYPNARTDSPTMFLKVYRKNTLMKGLGGESSPYPQECFVDIFPLEGMPENKLLRKMKGILANSIRLIANTVGESVPLAEWEKEFYRTDKSLYRVMRLRRNIGKCFSVIGHKYWVLWYDKLVRNPSLDGMVGFPTGRKLYDGETFEASVFLPPGKGRFEGIDVYLPADSHSYLSNLYGDYMMLPTNEERERHFFVEFHVSGEFYERR